MSRSRPRTFFAGSGREQPSSTSVHTSAITRCLRRCSPARRGSVWAFEPEPTNAAFLRRHTYLNNCRNVHVEELAVSNSDGNARFLCGKGSGTGHLDQTGDMEVRTVRLTEFCAERGISPSALKIDVEGAEAAVLEGAKELILKSRPVIFLSTHGPAAHAHCLEWLRAAGYSLRPILGGRIEDAAEILALPDGAIA